MVEPVISIVADQATAKCADGGGLRTDPAWDDLPHEPRFEALLKPVGLDVWPK